MAAAELSSKSTVIQRVVRFIAVPPWWMEAVAWVGIVAAIAGIRIYLWHLVPFYLWSSDALSYAEPAMRWMETATWDNAPVRGPVYSLFIAGALKGWGALDSVIILQHILGGAAVLLAVVTLRVMHGRRALWPLIVCALAYAFYGGPLAVEHLVRAETLLLFFSTVALASWFFAMNRGQPGWLWLTGISFALMTLTKNVFLPLPFVVLVQLWAGRTGRAWTIKGTAIFLSALILPFAGAAIFSRMTQHTQPHEPQAGLLLYARVAQFTKLDDGIHPEIKELIRPDIEAYRKLGRLSNNLILHRTAVPRMSAYLAAQGKSPSDLNHLCRQLAFEAIRTHPRQYLLQVLHDCGSLHRGFGSSLRGPDAAELQHTQKVLDRMTPNPIFEREKLDQLIPQRLQKSHLSRYRDWVDCAWLFNFYPVLCTSLLLPVCCWLARGTTRWWWFGCLAVWLFTIVLLSTVGRPLNRYLIPVTPIIFWTLSSAIIFAWLALVRWVERCLDPALTSPEPSA